MTKPFEAVDDKGRGWLVYKDDPGWDMCHTLDLAGVTNIVLPSRSYITGNLTNPPAFNFDINPEIIRMNPDVARLYARQVRLRDCVTFLKEKSS